MSKYRFFLTVAIALVIFVSMTGLSLGTPVLFGIEEETKRTEAESTEESEELSHSQLFSHIPLRSVFNPLHHHGHHFVENILNTHLYSSEFLCRLFNHSPPRTS